MLATVAGKSQNEWERSVMWKRVAGPIALVSLLWLAVGGATLYHVNGVYDAHVRSLNEKLATVQSTDTMQDALWKLQATVLEVTEQADSHTRLEVAGLVNVFERQLSQAEGQCRTPEAQELLQAIRQGFARYRDCMDRRLALSLPPGERRAPAEELARLAHEVSESCKGLVEHNRRLVERSTTQDSPLVVFDVLMLVVWIAGPTLGILCGLWVARSLRQSISQISISLTDAAGGLEHEVGKLDLRPSDDLPELHQQVQAVSSHIKEVLEQLAQARQETMLADRLAAVGELAAGVAHELRNPLTAVKLLIQNAAQRPTERPLSEKQLRIVQDQLVRMECTIQGLLDFARPPNMHRVRHDLRDTLRRALNLVEGRAKQENVTIREECPPVPVVVDGDPEQLHQVFVNLLLNGIESMPEGGPLQVVLQTPANGDGCARVMVCDDGNGIPDTVRERLFEPFVTSKERGTGLGLAISRRIIEQHGGKLTAANRARKGAVFTVQLPCRP
jgi:signal transduction histidine kinase